ncbi:hypothetical protein VF21_02492 [Pseudogymnoascus sp. 05NY08]|nr:hypothetical protein VF21_02492 [Pseudogymnoascus sp. 05NY08]
MEFPVEGAFTLNAYASSRVPHLGPMIQTQVQEAREQRNRTLRDRARYMERILKHEIRRISLDTESLRVRAEAILGEGNLREGSADATDSSCDDELVIGDETCTIDPVDGDTATHYSGEFSYWNFSMRIKRLLEDRVQSPGGQLRPHAYSRYQKWSSLFGPDGALELIKYEMAHLPAFEELLTHEGIADEACLKFGDTFDAAMSGKAWARLKDAYTSMQRDHGEDGDVIRECKLIEDPKAAEEFTQMKSCIGAVVHPAGQGNLNLQAKTPVVEVSDRDANGWITVKTPRGDVRTKAVMHATDRWASHLLPDFGNLIFGGRGSLASLKAPEGFFKHTGAQHWDEIVNNYHLQLPPPYNTVILGGGKSLLVHDPRSYILNDSEDKQFDGLPEFYQSWPASDVAQWPGEGRAELAKVLDKGGVWTGVMSSSIDEFPFVGAVPNHKGDFIAAGFSGHGMPRILLSTAHVVPLILTSLGIESTPPALVAPYPALPKPFQIATDRMEKLQKINVKAKYEAEMKMNFESAKEEFCNDDRSRPRVA